MESTKQRSYTNQRIFTNQPLLIKTLICLAIIFIFWFLPPLAPITQVGMRVIGVFIGTVLLLSIVDTVWPAFLSFALLSLTGSLTMNEILAGSIGNWIIMFVIASFVLTDALNESGFTRRVTIFFMTRNFVMRSPWTFTYVYLLVAWFIGLFMDSVAATLFFLPFTKIILDALGYKHNDAYANMLTMAAIFSINIAGAGTPISHSLVLLGMGIYQQATGQAVGMFEYIKFGFPISVILLAVLFFILRFLIRPDMSKFEGFDVKKALGEQKPMQIREKVIVSIFFFVVAMWVIPGILALFLPATNAIRMFLGLFSITFWAMMGMVALAVVRIDDKPIISLKHHLENGFAWGIIFFIAIGVLLGSAMSHPSVGLNEFILHYLTPVLQNIPDTLIILLFAFVTIAVTNAASNVTTITVMTTVAVSIAASIPGINPMLLAFTTTLCGTLAFVLPSSYAPIALLHADENSDSGKVIRYGMLMVVLCSLLIAFVGFPLVNALF